MKIRNLDEILRIKSSGEQNFSYDYIELPEVRENFIIDNYGKYIFMGSLKDFKGMIVSYLKLFDYYPIKEISISGYNIMVFKNNNREFVFIQYEPLEDLHLILNYGGERIVFSTGIKNVNFSIFSIVGSDVESLNILPYFCIQEDLFIVLDISKFLEMLFNQSIGNSKGEYIYFI